MSSENEDEGLLSFLDLLTCVMIAMMVLAVILAVTMATGGSMAIVVDEPVPASPPVLVEPRSPTEVAKDPQVLVGMLTVLGGRGSSLARPSLKGWAAQGWQTSRRRVTLDDAGGGLRLGMRFAAPAPDEARSPKLTLTFDLETRQRWVAVDRLPGGAAPSGLHRRLEQLSASSARMDRLDEQQRHRIAQGFRAGGVALAGRPLSQVWPEALGELACLLDQEQLADKAGPERRALGPARLEALTAAFAELCHGLGGTALDLEELARSPLAYLVIRTNRGVKRRLWLGIENRVPAVSTLSIAATTDTIDDPTW